MDRIEIELGAWEAAPCPIYTKNVDLELAERMLFDEMWDIFDEEEIEMYLKGGGDDEERDAFMSKLCEKEEDIVIEYGGIYYEDMFEDVACPHCNGELIIEGKSGLKKCLECGNEF